MRKPTLSLFVMVYKGGDLWRAAADSINKCADLFDEILVTVNFTDLQEADVATARTIQHAKLRVITQRVLLGPVDHFQNAASQLQSDYTLCFCHDDLLNRSGVMDVLQLLCMSPVGEASVWGSWVWTETAKMHRGSARVLEAYPEGVSVGAFYLQNLNNYFESNLSGIVFPTAALLNNMHVIAASREGFGIELQLVTLPGVTKILQAPTPIAEILLRSDSAGSAKSPFNRMCDGALVILNIARFSHLEPNERRSILAFLAAHLVKARSWPLLLQVFRLTTRNRQLAKVSRVKIWCILTTSCLKIIAQKIRDTLWGNERERWI